ncbi:MAG: GMC family oxidoreductase [Paracoccaceae bacterium]
MDVDYIVIGAGSAGAVVAARLSEDPALCVALLEAGPPDTNPWIHVPVGYFRTMGNPATDWCYRTEPDPGLAGRAIAWPRGRVLGGSSSINGLLYVRGQREDYDGWRQLGNPGWGWDDVLPLFRRAERWEDAGADPDGLRGRDGPIAVGRSRLSRSAVDAWLEAAVAAGYSRNPDYNGRVQEGVAHFQMTADRGRRASTAVGYLRPARNRPNLEILTRTAVTRLVIAGDRVVGVEARRGGEILRLTARAEVILSAGAIATPQLLMVSGIGPPDALRAHGIAVARAAPGVGQNLQDHLQARPVYRCRARTINTEIRNPLRKLAMAIEYALFRTGPMTMAASLGTAFLKTDPRLATPDIQFHIQPFSADSPAEGPHPFDAITASVLQLRPESTGRIVLKSPDMAVAPAIHPNYLATETDCATLVAGIRIARKIAATPPFRDLVVFEHAPGPGVPDDAARLLDWARRTAVTIYHPTGTAKMGPESDPMAVVDPRLRVRGVANLRVADASIFPTIPSGNTNAPAIMVGEKASDLILADAR